jgi:hypothetical protein
MSNKSHLFAQFQEEKILQESGRLLFSLLNVFSSNGYQISFYDNISREHFGKYGRLIHHLDNFSLSSAPPNNTENSIYLFDKEDKTIGRLPWHKKIRVSFDIFSPYWFRNPIIMPYPMHPSHATTDLEERLKLLRSSERNVGVFFSGDTKEYVRNRVRYPKPKLPRLEIINSILDRMGKNVLHIEDLSVLKNLNDSSCIQKCVIVDTNKVWVDEKDWLGIIARANYFLSPPGIVMPMCHNIVEAMAVGAIPITNYPEWFDPPLTHMKDCIVFDEKDDLIEKVKTALYMDQSQIERMRANTIAYYQNHLSPVTLVNRIESCDDNEITLLLITENNMARKYSKLNKNSILIRGTSSTINKAWFERLSNYLFHSSSG